MQANYLTALRSERWAAVRRAIALFCLLFFVTAGLVHAHHDAAEQTFVSATTQVAANDCAGKSGAGDTAQCHCCFVGFALLELPTMQTQHRASVELAGPDLPVPLQAARRNDTPPPKFSA